MNSEPISFQAKGCEICGGRLGAGSRTCSFKCKGELARREARSKWEARPCDQCGRQCSKKPSVAAITERWFCSNSCASKARNARRIAEGRFYQPIKPRRGITRPCGQCGQPVYATQREIDAGLKKFCGRACLTKSQNKSVEVACTACGKLFKRKASQDTKTCGKECMGKLSRRREIGRMVNGKPARKNSSGYIIAWAPDHPKAWGAGWYFEHRLVMEAHLGRRLDSEEDVHHVNGIKDDNRVENLQVMHHHAHKLITAKERKEKRLSEAAELAEYRKRYGAL